MSAPTTCEGGCEWRPFSALSPRLARGRGRRAPPSSRGLDRSAASCASCSLTFKRTTDRRRPGAPDPTATLCGSGGFNGCRDVASQRLGARKRARDALDLALARCDLATGFAAPAALNMLAAPGRQEHSRPPAARRLHGARKSSSRWAANPVSHGIHQRTPLGPGRARRRTAAETSAGERWANASRGQLKPASRSSRRRSRKARRTRRSEPDCFPGATSGPGGRGPSILSPKSPTRRAISHRCRLAFGPPPLPPPGDHRPRTA
jgi:hypothetical protein